jgi:regulator of cell morphogenesis and NO signaling
MMMKSLSTTKTVREFALEIPGATRIFEKLGIDYCCGGAKSLQDACLSAGVPAEVALDLLTQAPSSGKNRVDEKDWQTEPLSQLIAHIVNKHHRFVREELVRLSQLLAKVCSVHAQNHPELLRLREIFQNLEEELMVHMYKEEQILFPYVGQLEEAIKRQAPVPVAFFGTVRNPVRIMLQEHDDAGDALKRMRQMTSNYTAPADACISFRTLYQALEEFERDLHQHIHLENNILFPRVAEMEAAA